jgi:hypothetical protein
MSFHVRSYLLAVYCSPLRPDASSPYFCLNCRVVIYLMVVRYLEHDVGCNSRCSREIVFTIRLYEIQHILVNIGD